MIGASKTHRQRGRDGFQRHRMLPPAAGRGVVARTAGSLALAGAVLLSLGLCRPAAAQKSYELPRCKTDAKGKVYIALGRTVLGLPPPNANGGIGQAVPKDAMLPAPDPAEPEGCPDNPAQVQSQGLTAFLPLASDPVRPGQSRQNVWATGSGLRLWRIEVFPKRSAGYPDPEPSLSHAVLVESECASTNPDWSESNGVEICLVRPHPSPYGMDSPRNWGRSYRVASDRYGTPRGGPFMFTCDPNAGQPHWAADCDVGYVLTGGLRLTYEFLPPESGYPASFVDDVIAFDREARALLADGLWPDYPWPVLPSSR